MNLVLLAIDCCPKAAHCAHPIEKIKRPQRGDDR
jgi:hypothetical protein